MILFDLVLQASYTDRPHSRQTKMGTGFLRFRIWEDKYPATD